MPIGKFMCRQLSSALVLSSAIIVHTYAEEARLRWCVAQRAGENQFVEAAYDLHASSVALVNWSFALFACHHVYAHYFASTRLWTVFSSLVCYEAYFVYASSRVPTDAYEDQYRFGIYNVHGRVTLVQTLACILVFKTFAQYVHACVTFFDRHYLHPAAKPVPGRLRVIPAAAQV